MTKTEYIIIGNTRVNVTVNFDSQSIIITSEPYIEEEVTISFDGQQRKFSVNREKLQNGIIEFSHKETKESINEFFSI